MHRIKRELDRCKKKKKKTFSDAFVHLECFFHKSFNENIANYITRLRRAVLYIESPNRTLHGPFLFYPERDTYRRSRFSSTMKKKKKKNTKQTKNINNLRFGKDS